MTTALDEVELTAAGHAFRARVHPAERAGGDVLVWLHGGAFMFGTIDMPEADHVARRLAALGVTVVSVDYTLAPLDALDALAPPEPVLGLDVPSPEEMRAEAAAAGPRARFPVASLQVVAAFEWAVSHAADLGGVPGRVALGGASAGGNLAAGAALRLRGAAAEPSSLVLVYPVLHDPLPVAGDDLEALLEGLPGFLTFPPAATEAINRNYLGDADDPEGFAFPGGHDVRGLPPTLIVTAERDRLRASGDRFAGELIEAGVDVRVIRRHGALHGFLNEPGDAAAEETIAAVAATLAAARHGAVS